MTVRFEALEHCADGGFAPVVLECQGSTEHGWLVRRNGAPHLELGPGYRLLRTLQCGVCSTDLARRFLPFPLPQVIGHELVAEDEDGRACVVEINASHRARGVDTACPFCDGNLPTHCPDRIVLGIHDLPGGFGRYVLAPRHAVLPVPDAVPLQTAVLVEPFAAALHAVERTAPRRRDTVAVLGPRRLGMLVIAALRGWSDRTGSELEVLAVARRPEMAALARELGADRALLASDELAPACADIVIDTTGNPDALPLAARLARRELHLKSTHGQPAAGLGHPTEMVVDELGLRGFEAAAVPPDASLAWLAAAAPPPALRHRVLRASSPAALAEQLHQHPPRGGLPRADLAVAASPGEVDAAVRPEPGRETALVRPRGDVLLLPSADYSGAPLLEAIAHGRLRLSTSRCGDFARALELLAEPSLARRLGALMVTHRFAPEQLGDAFATAASPACLKAVVEHPA